MRNFLIRSSISIIVILLFIFTIGVVMIVFSPIHSGDILFPLQDFTEQQIIYFYRNPVSRSAYMLDLVDRRINDLSIQTNTQYELIALGVLDKAIDQATQAISFVPQNEGDSLRSRLLSLMEHADEVLKKLGIVAINNPITFQKMQSKITALLQMLGKSNVSNSELQLISQIGADNPKNISNTFVAAYSASGLIPFPPGSPGAIHAFYPLAGKHTLLSCEGCHNSGKYVGITNTCISCHVQKRPNQHYTDECEFCHTPVSWTDIHFDHTSDFAIDCNSCHEKDKPADHYQGRCSACHVTQAWDIVTFDHAVAGAMDCISCHGKSAPANHFPGQCSNCHNTVDWKSVIFDHTGLVNCISCHAGDAPTNHYAGQCSNCHDTGGSWANAHFNHSGYTDCISCHAGDAPANHYSGQCSNCHDTGGSWVNVHFDHRNFTDCISCHARNAPANHYSGQCSNCHRTDTWGGAVFDHAGLTDCSSCHSSTAPPNHYPHQCSVCHSTDTWGGASFNHNSGITDCLSCHLRDRPSEHDQGQCSNCHGTQNWGDEGGDRGLNPSYNGVFLRVSCLNCHIPTTIRLVEDIKQ